MFTQGFEKQAGIKDMWLKARGLVGSAKGGITKGVSGAVETVKSGLRAGAEAERAGYRAARFPERPLPGTLSGQTAVRKAEQKAGGRLGAEEQQKIMQQHHEEAKQRSLGTLGRKGFRGEKPSFAQRHPIATAGGAFLAGKYMFGDKEKKEEGPQVIYPQTGY